MSALVTQGLRRAPKLDRAIQDFEEAIRLKPDYPHALHNCTAAFELKGKRSQVAQSSSETASQR
jgi:tetratricopeptide (TPR) repeat protein